MDNKSKNWINGATYLLVVIAVIAFVLLGVVMCSCIW